MQQFLLQSVLVIFLLRPVLSMVALQRLAKPFVCGDIHWQSVKCVLADMDGTLLNSKLSIPERSMNAISAIKQAGIKFFPATGRTRKGMLTAGGPKLLEVLGGDPSAIPGVYNQGLVVYGDHGKLIYEDSLNSDALELSVEYCEKNALSVIGYWRDSIVTNKITALTEASANGKEPLPEKVDEGLLNFHNSGKKLNKLIIIAPEPEIIRRRKEVELMLQNMAAVTQAVPGMLEILPFGASKGHGVQNLLLHFGIQPTNCMAFGDGENDIEMINLVQYGIAMSNAREKLLSQAFRQTLSNDEDGVAFVLESLLRRRSESMNSLVVNSQ
jgi:Cof subfamily protein (haloacid dehalogenase superfamily)